MLIPLTSCTTSFSKCIYTKNQHVTDQYSAIVITVNIETEILNIEKYFNFGFRLNDFQLFQLHANSFVLKRYIKRGKVLILLL